MKLLNRAALLASALLLPALTQASNQPLIETFSAFTQCDASFFSSLQAHRDAWEAIVPLKQEKDISWIAVKNRAKDNENIVSFKGTPQVAGIKLLSYFDDSTNLDEHGYYLFWGFVVEGGPDEVAHHLAPLLKRPEQLQPFDDTYVRSELRDGNSWKVIQPLKGAPGTARLERVLLIEPDGPQRTRSRVSCSLQGAFDTAAFTEVRPDIPAADYPQPAPNIDIDSIAVPEGPLKSLDLPLLQPRFKSVRYTYGTKKNSTKQSRPVSIVMTAEAGLLNKTEIYSENFQVQRLTKADLVQLKAKMIGIGDSRVLVTRELHLHAPQRWSTGQILSASAHMEESPARPGDKPRTSEMVCTVGKRFPANHVFATLTGDAVELACNYGNSRSTSAFIEDLGIAITLESGQHLYEVTALEVVR